jgi:hypothetical protein
MTNLWTMITLAAWTFGVRFTFFLAQLLVML